ncbi:MAG: FecR domain-containing protein [Desulfobacterales bacterium]|nr:FecR domain-containing protein [Desulfobacterales bacterium]
MRQILKYQLCLVCFLAALGALLVCAGTAQAASAGKFIFVSGKVWVVSSTGEKRLARKGDDVRESDTIISGTRSYAQLLMQDEGFIAVRPNTRMRIDVFRYNGRGDDEGRSVLSLVRGGFRAITGFIGHTNKENYEIRTPVATIGIRGTDHEPMFIPVPAPGEVPMGRPGVYDKVNVGETYIQNEAGIVIIGENEVGFAPDAATMPVSFVEIPAFYESAPAPEQEEEQEEEAGAAEEDAVASKEEQVAAPGEESDVSGNEYAGETLDATTTGEGREIIQPVVAVTDGGAPLDLTTSFSCKPYRIAAFAAYDPRSLTETALAPTLVEGMPNDPSRITTDASGNLLGFDSRLPQYDAAAGETTWSPVRLEIGTCTLADTGEDTTTGIRWGRWSSGTISAKLSDGTAVTDFNPLDLHYIYTPEMSTPVLLPVSGTYNYKLAGWTNPTDNLGNVGVLNEACLTADFSAMTVDAGVNVTILAASLTFDASAVGMPIDEGAGFFAERLDGTGTLNVSCTGGGEGPTNSGVLAGGFTGPTGEGAGLTYSLNTTDGGSINTTVSGVAAFSR